MAPRRKYEAPALAFPSLMATVTPIRVRKPGRRAGTCPSSAMPASPRPSLAAALASWLAGSGHPEDGALLCPYLPSPLDAELSAALAAPGASRP